MGRVVDGQLRLDDALPDGPGPAPSSVVIVRFDGVWPDLVGFRLRLREGSGAPQWDGAQRVMSVFLPKGDTTTIGVSCTLKDEAALRTLGLWDWLTERLDQLVADNRLDTVAREARLAQLQAMSLLGQSWMFTPPRELTLSHVVQQPVEQPKINRLNIIRLPGATYALLSGVIGVHGESTSQVELNAIGGPPAFKTPFVLPPARLTSPEPQPGQPAPVATFVAANDEVTIHGPNVAEIERTLATAVKDLMDDWESILDLANGVQPFDQAARRERDMIKARRSDVLATLTAFDSGTFLERWAAAARAGTQSHKFAENFIGFPQPGPDTLENQDLFNAAIRIVGDPVAGIPGHALDVVAAAAKARQRLEGFTARHDFGDTKYHRLTYEAVATTRFGDCFPPATASTLDVTRKSERLVVDVPSTASPPPPRVTHVVPVFPWKRQGAVAAQGFSSERGAGGLRVYLDGPWFASGDGELLGVAIVTIPAASVIQHGTTLVETNWVRDPLWDTDRLPNLPAKADFRDAQGVFESILLPDGLRFTVTIVGYPVKVDDSGRHYADVILDTASSYYPFVRLALTRFQPNSIRGMQSSPVVLTDFTQLTPKRGVTVQRREALLLEVAVSGLTHRSATDPTALGTTGPTGTKVRVTVQQRIPGTADDAGWLPEGATVDSQRAGQVWNGTVRIPSRPSGTLRLLVEEIEDHAAFRQSSTDRVVRERVVFAETVPV